MPRAELPNGLQIGSYSTGTMRPQDLGPVMVDLLRALNDERWMCWDAEWHYITEDGFDPDAYPTSAFDDVAEAMADLEAAIQDALPEGYTWGTLDGDGADFGIWPAPESEEGEIFSENTIVVSYPLKRRTYEARQISGPTWGVFEYDGLVQVRRVGPALNNRSTITRFAEVINEAISDFIVRNEL